MSTNGTVYLTGDWLRRRGACRESRAAFRAMYGARAAVTAANVRKWRANKAERFNMYWLAYALNDHEHICTNCYPELTDAQVARAIRAALRKQARV